MAQTISDVISADLRKRQERGRAGELGNTTQGLTGSCGHRGKAQGASGRTLREGYSAQDRWTRQEVRVEVVGDSGHDLGGCAASRYAVARLYLVPKILPQYHLSSFPPSLSLKESERRGGRRGRSPGLGSRASCGSTPHLGIRVIGFTSRR